MTECNLHKVVAYLLSKDETDELCDHQLAQDCSISLNSVLIVLKSIWLDDIDEQLFFTNGRRNQLYNVVIQDKGRILIKSITILLQSVNWSQDSVECFLRILDYIKHIDSFYNTTRAYNLTNDVCCHCIDLLLSSISSHTHMKYRELELSLLEVISVCLESLSRIRSHLVDLIPCYEIDIIDKLLLSKWSTTQFIHISKKVFCPMKSVLKKRHFSILLESISSMVIKNTYDTTDHLISLMDIVGQILEYRRDSAWGQLFRMIYMCIPLITSQPMKDHLYQILSTYSNCVQYLICIIEDTSVFFNEYLSRNMETAVNEDIKEYHIHHDHILIFENVPMVPLITFYDLTLLLQLYCHHKRSTDILDTNNTGINNDISHNMSDILSLHCTRSILMVLFTLSRLKMIGLYVGYTDVHTHNIKITSMEYTTSYHTLSHTQVICIWSEAIQAIYDDIIQWNSICSAQRNSDDIDHSYVSYMSKFVEIFLQVVKEPRIVHECVQIMHSELISSIYKNIPISIRQSRSSLKSSMTLRGSHSNAGHTKQNSLSSTSQYENDIGNTVDVDVELSPTRSHHHTQYLQEHRKFLRLMVSQCFKLMSSFIVSCYKHVSEESRCIIIQSLFQSICQPHSTNNSDNAVRKNDVDDGLDDNCISMMMDIIKCICELHYDTLCNMNTLFLSYVQPICALLSSSLSLSLSLQSLSSLYALLGGMKDIFLLYQWDNCIFALVTTLITEASSPSNTTHPTTDIVTSNDYCERYIYYMLYICTELDNNYQMKIFSCISNVINDLSTGLELRQYCYTHLIQLLKTTSTCTGTDEGSQENLLSYEALTVLREALLPRLLRFFENKSEYSYKKTIHSTSTRNTVSYTLNLKSYCELSKTSDDFSSLLLTYCLIFFHQCPLYITTFYEMITTDILESLTWDQIIATNMNSCNNNYDKNSFSSSGSSRGMGQSHIRKGIIKAGHRYHPHPAMEDFYSSPLYQIYKFLDSILCYLKDSKHYSTIVTDKIPIIIMTYQLIFSIWSIIECSVKYPITSHCAFSEDSIKDIYVSGIVLQSMLDLVIDHASHPQLYVTTTDSTSNKEPRKSGKCQEYLWSIPVHDYTTFQLGMKNWLSRRDGNSQMSCDNTTGIRFMTSLKPQVASSDEWLHILTSYLQYYSSPSINMKENVLVDIDGDSGILSSSIIMNIYKVLDTLPLTIILGGLNNYYQYTHNHSYNGHLNHRSSIIPSSNLLNITQYIGHIKSSLRLYHITVSSSYNQSTLCEQFRDKCHDFHERIRLISDKHIQQSQLESNTNMNHIVWDSSSSESESESESDDDSNKQYRSIRNDSNARKYHYKKKITSDSTVNDLNEYNSDSNSDSSKDDSSHITLKSSTHTKSHHTSSLKNAFKVEYKMPSLLYHLIKSLPLLSDISLIRPDYHPYIIYNKTLATYHRHSLLPIPIYNENEYMNKMKYCLFHTRENMLSSIKDMTECHTHHKEADDIDANNYHKQFKCSDEEILALIQSGGGNNISIIDTYVDSLLEIASYLAYELYCHMKYGTTTDGVKILVELLQELYERLHDILIISFPRYIYHDEIYTKQKLNQLRDIQYIILHSISYCRSDTSYSLFEILCEVYMTYSGTILMGIENIKNLLNSIKNEYSIPNTCMRIAACSPIQIYDILSESWSVSAELSETINYTQSIMNLWLLFICNHLYNIYEMIFPVLEGKNIISDKHHDVVDEDKDNQFLSWHNIIKGENYLLGTTDEDISMRTIVYELFKICISLFIPTAATINECLNDRGGHEIENMLNDDDLYDTSSSDNDEDASFQQQSRTRSPLLHTKCNISPNMQVLKTHSKAVYVNIPEKSMSKILKILYKYYMRLQKDMTRVVQVTKSVKKQLREYLSKCDRRNKAYDIKILEQYIHDLGDSFSHCIVFDAFIRIFETCSYMEFITNFNDYMHRIEGNENTIIQRNNKMCLTIVHKINEIVWSFSQLQQEFHDMNLTKLMEAFCKQQDDVDVSDNISFVWLSYQVITNIIDAYSKLQSKIIATHTSSSGRKYNNNNNMRHHHLYGHSEDTQDKNESKMIMMIEETTTTTTVISVHNKSRKRLRSRNEVIDDWLRQNDDDDGEGGGGQDTYADLEDFIVT